MNIFKRKISFKKNLKTDLLHCDKVIGNLKLKNISQNFLDQNELNLRYLIIGFFRFLFIRKKNITLSDFYFIEMIKSYSPKVVLGHDMTGITFRIKKLIPSLSTITYQLAFIFKNDEDYYKNNFRNKSTDIYLVYDKRSKEMMQKYVKAKYKIFGSVKSSFTKLLKKNKIIKYDLLYISPFRSMNLQTKNNIRQNNNERKYLKCIKDYCFKNNKKICIALSSNRKDKKNINQNDEKKFYKSIIPFVHFEDNQSINLVRKSNVIISSLSNLGYELLMKREKVLFLTNDKEKFKFFESNKLPFVYYVNNTKNIKIKINKLASFKKNQWNNILDRYTNSKNCEKKLKLLVTSYVK